jgi:competence ComEA-like helix-hairpin-helix protein
VTSALALALACGLLVASAEPAEIRPVELNLATLEELQTLPGIGPRKAEAIIELRKKRPFTRVTQLLEVKGVGRKTLERLKPWVRVTPFAPATSATSVSAPAPAATAP